jgi:hypothetical protein
MEKLKEEKLALAKSKQPKQIQTNNTPRKIKIQKKSPVI